eukprot:11203661-Lingulodinium_polyedra.AAC.1
MAKSWQPGASPRMSTAHRCGRFCGAPMVLCVEHASRDAVARGAGLANAGRFALLVGRHAVVLLPEESQ